MKIILNGEDRSVPDGLSVSGLLEHLDIPAAKVAVERNRAIVPRSAYGETALESGDAIEIVQFIGGG